MNYQYSTSNRSAHFSMKKISLRLVTQGGPRPKHLQAAFVPHSCIDHATSDAETFPRPC